MISPIIKKTYLKASNSLVVFRVIGWVFFKYYDIPKVRASIESPSLVLEPLASTEVRSVLSVS